MTKKYGSPEWGKSCWAVSCSREWETSKGEERHGGHRMNIQMQMWDWMIGADGMNEGRKLR